MKINLKYSKYDTLLHVSSQDLFKYFDYNSIDDFRYRNVQHLIDKVNNLEENLQIFKEPSLEGKKWLLLNLEDSPHCSFYYSQNFSKKEVGDLLEDLISISYDKNQMLFNFLKRTLPLNLFEKYE